MVNMRKIRISILIIVALLTIGIIFTSSGQAFADTTSCTLRSLGINGIGTLNVSSTNITQGTAITFSTTTSILNPPSSDVSAGITVEYVRFNGQNYSGSGSISTTGLLGTYTMTAYFKMTIRDVESGTILGTNTNSCSITINVNLPTYKVTFNPNGGTRTGGGELVQYIEKGSSATPPSVVREGYRFLGWSGSYSNVTGDTTVVAQWQKLEYLVTFDLGGGYIISGSSSQYVSYGGSATPPVVTRTGYTFSGWSGTYTNVTSSRVIYACWVDDIKPQGAITMTSGSSPYNGLVGNDFSYFASDSGSGIAYCEYQTPGSEIWQNYTNGAVIARNSTEGLYRFRAIDRDGNVSEKSECTLLKIDTFGNEENIRDSFRVTSWYKVVLPPRIFDTATKNISGTYTFASYDTALAFCIAKETEFRVSSVENGWIYINILNESVSQLYTDENLLNEAILKYAESYISEEQQFELGTNNYYIPINTSFQQDSTALNTPSLTLPSFLNIYKQYKLYMCPSYFIFQKYSYNGITISDSVTLSYIADDYSLIDGATISIGFENNIKTALENEEQLLQGYYLVTETDKIGNIQSYIVYLDVQAPGINVIVNDGEADERSVRFDAEYIDQYAGTFYYYNLSISSFFDNKDDYACVKIVGRNLDKIFTNVEDVPILQFSDNYYGKYEITIYDRSKNTLVFDVVIAGSPPSWYYTSLTNQTKLTLTVSVNDKYNAITKLELFKINSIGEYQQIDVDDDGTVVSSATLSYVLRNGGKFTVRVTDLFGRVTEMTPIFYRKGLPSGTFKGVSEGGTTNESVTFTYAAGNIKIYQIGQDGVKNLDYSISPVYDSLSKTYTAVFPTTENEEIHYLIFLSTIDDEGIFIEYEFKIDCEPPVFEIIDIEGQIIPQDGSTVNAFKVTWTEDVSARVALNNGISSVYNGGVLDKDGIYSFELKDKAGNTINFKVALDNSVSFAISGDYKEIDGKIYAKNDLTFFVMESYSYFRIEGKKAGVIDNGQAITFEDEYTVNVTDSYGNQLSKTIIIDKTAPYYSLFGVLPNGKTNGSVKLAFEDNAVCVYNNTTTNAQGELASGDNITQHGKYVITITDIAGNKIDLNFEIDIAIDVETNIVDGQIFTDTASIKFLEELAAVKITKDGEEVSLNKKYEELGFYILTARDVAGNELILSWEIIPKEYKTFIYELPSDFELLGINKDGQFYTEYSLNGSVLTIEETGEYSVILSNSVTGNEFDVEILVDCDLPTVVLSGIEEDGTAMGQVSFKNYSKTNLEKQLFFNGTEINYSGFNRAGNLQTRFD